MHFLHGNPSKLSHAQALDELRPDVELPNCPAHLNSVARAEYRRLGAELERYGLVSKLDRGVLSMMAVEWSRHVWAEQKITEANDCDEKGEAGLIETTSSGYRQMSAFLIISRKSIDLYLKLATEFGLTPSARTRVTPGARQLGLPGVESKPEAPSLRMFS